MKVTQLKNLLKEINAPNEFIAEALDKTHPLYWIFVIKNVRVNSIAPSMEEFRKHKARFDVFINGLFIADVDYIIQHIDNDLIIKFKKGNFPPLDRFGNPYDIEDTDEVKIIGDVENVN
jgi:hypothetical protein